MNKVILLGRPTADPTVKTITNENNEEIMYVNFILAVNHYVKGEQKAEFIPCVAFRKTAEFIERYIMKGKRILVEGELKTNSYTNTDGEKRYTMNVLVRSVEFADNLSVPAQHEGADITESDNEFINLADDAYLPFQ